MTASRADGHFEPRPGARARPEPETDYWMTSVTVTVRDSDPLVPVIVSA
jgi:hypothetical protein